MIWVHHSQPEYEALVQFISVRICGAVRDMTQGTVAVTSVGGKIAAVLFHNWDKVAGVVEISGASDSKRWLSRSVLAELFGYAFGKLGCQAITAHIDPDNEPLSRILLAYGFKRYDVPRLRGRNKGDAILVLGDDDWRANGFHKEYP